MPTTKRPIEIDDLYRMVTIEEPRFSPDGRWIAYVQVTCDRFEDAYRRTIWLAPTEGGQPVQITRSGKDGAPRWSPDGRTLAFVSGRGERPQIFLLPVGDPGGEPRHRVSRPKEQIAWFDRYCKPRRGRQPQPKLTPPA